MPQRAARGKGLTRKVGPFPLWVWGVGLLSAIALGIYMRRRLASSQTGQATAANTPTEDTSGGTFQGTGGDTLAADLTNVEQELSSLDQSVQMLADSINSGAFGAGGGGFDVGGSGDSLAMPNDPV